MTSALVIGRADLPPVIELRQYSLRPSGRESLIELFEKELLEPQEAVGMRILGQFRDLDRPDRFVWLRGFPDMAARERALAAFYEGPVWAKHRDAANATMLHSDDVLLLRPARVGGQFREGLRPRPPAGIQGGRPVLTAAIHLLREPVDAGFLRWYTAEVEPVLERAGSQRLALLETEPAANTYRRLPVREGEFAVVRLSRFRDEATLTAVRRRVEQDPGCAAVERRLRAHLVAAPQILRLQPTPRSSIR
jgi:NIPSNAP